MSFSCRRSERLDVFFHVKICAKLRDWTPVVPTFPPQNVADSTRPGKRLQKTNWKDPPCDFHGKTHVISRRPYFE